MTHTKEVQALIYAAKVASSIFKNTGNSVLAYDLEVAIKALEPAPPKGKS